MTPSPAVAKAWPEPRWGRRRAMTGKRRGKEVHKVRSGQEHPLNRREPNVPGKPGARIQDVCTLPGKAHEQFCRQTLPFLSKLALGNRCLAAASGVSRGAGSVRSTRPRILHSGRDVPCRRMSRSAEVSLAVKVSMGCNPSLEGPSLLLAGKKGKKDFLIFSHQEQSFSRCSSRSPPSEAALSAVCSMVLCWQLGNPSQLSKIPSAT